MQPSPLSLATRALRIQADAKIVSTASDTFCFGDFRLVVRERVLLKDNVPVSVGSRAFDVLLALVERAGETVNREELFDRVWPDVVVTKVNLRVHVAGLRKTLGEGRDGNRFIVNVAGRGYRFVAPVSRLQATNGNLTAPPPVRLTLATDFDNAVRFVNLASIANPSGVPLAVATALGYEAASQESLDCLIGHLRDKEMLLVFDNCDHVFAGVVQFTDRLFSEAPLIHVVISSRKALHLSHTL